VKMIELNHQWKMRQEELFCGKEKAAAVARKTDGWYENINLPCDVHMPLIACGEIGDPMVGKNAELCEWIEDRSWWFKKTFTVSKEALTALRTDLVLDGLDAEADIFLNGDHLGHHRSQTYPFRKEVRDLLVEGENELLVRVTTGLEHYNENELCTIHWKGKDYNSNRFLRETYGPRRDDRRTFVRKPQYVFGWDWMPRIASCGITGKAFLEIHNGIAVTDIKFTTLNIEDTKAQVKIDVEIDNEYPVSTRDAMIDTKLCFGEEVVAQFNADVSLNCGINQISFTAVLENPKLWWPNGMGEQNLYTVKVCASMSEKECDSKQIQSGIRTVTIDKQRLSEGRRFAVVVNGVRVFCKGGNWAPADGIYARATDEKIMKIVEEAQNANFNMIRVCGLGPYPADSFFEACDRCGIMVWHDFMFACGAYPDHEDWFVNEVRNEMNYQIRRVRNHPSVTVWCGNNECQISVENYGVRPYLGAERASHTRGVYIYNYVIPEYLRALSPELPYVNSSPFGGLNIKSETEGDSHSWSISFMQEFEHHDNRCFVPQNYWEEKTRFASENGCMGPLKLSSVKKFFGDEPVSKESDTWMYHKNEFEGCYTEPAIRINYGHTDQTIPDYLLYGGLFQGTMLEYGMRAFRTIPENHASIIWSYNDSWTENGWSQLDFYLVRKVSYYFEKRAFAHKKLLLRKEGNMMYVFATNDTMEPYCCNASFGYMYTDGTNKKEQTVSITVPAGTILQEIGKFSMDDCETNKGVFYAYSDTEEVAGDIYRDVLFKELEKKDPVLHVTNVVRSGNETYVTVQADVYAHAVHFDLPDEVHLSDHYFDLLPRQKKTITIFADVEQDQLVPKYATSC